MVALKVLLRVHGHLFEAMHKPQTEPNGLANWDARHILQDQRKQVGIVIALRPWPHKDERAGVHALAVGQAA